MSWPPTLTELKSDLDISDDRDDARLTRVLDAAVAFVERVRPGFGYPGTPDVGDAVTLTITATDDQGDPANTDTVTLEIELPDGTTDDTPTVDNPPAATGRYTFAYTAVQAGTHIARWATTGPTSVVAQTFEVRTTAGLPAPTADLRLGTIRLAGRWHTRRKSPEMLITAGEFGGARIPSFDPDIERLLKIGRFRGGVFA